MVPPPAISAPLPVRLPVTDMMPLISEKELVTLNTSIAVVDGVAGEATRS